MVLFVIRLQPTQNLHRILNRRLIDVDLLEAPHQGAVFFEIGAEFLVGGRTNAAQRARRQCRLEQVGRIHRPARRGTRTNDGVDFVDEQHGIWLRLKLGDNRLQTLFEITTIAGARQQRPHIERVDHRFDQHFRHIALDDALGQTFGNRRFAHTRIAHIKRVVLGATAEDLNGALDLLIATDQRIDLTSQRLLVEVDAVIAQRVLAALGGLFLTLIFLRRFSRRAGALHRAGLAATGGFGDAVADEVHRVQPRHVLRLQEIDSMAFTFAEQCHQHIGPGDFFLTGRLHMDRRTLNHALETGGRFRIARTVSGKARQFLIKEFGQVIA